MLRYLSNMRDESGKVTMGHRGAVRCVLGVGRAGSEIKGE